jgi:hypothetical protein
MRRAWLASLFGLLTCAGWSLAQTPPAVPDSAPPELAQPADDADSSRFWLTAEYLFWKVPGQHLPALVGTIPEKSAELVQQLPGGTITPVFGGSVDYGWQSGLRLGAGAWLGDGRQFGLDVGFFQLEQGQKHALFSSSARAPLGVTFNDTVANRQVLIMDAVPGLRDGSVAISASNRLWGAEANARFRLLELPIPGEVCLLAGFRHLQFDEGLDIESSSAAVPGGRLPCG